MVPAKSRDWPYDKKADIYMTETTKPRKAIESFKETIEQLVIAFILAFVFRAFVVEAFVIPTGSMADTLRGAHFRLTCCECGWRYNFGFDAQNYGYPKGVLPSRPLNIPAPRLNAGGIPICPLCGTPADTSYPRRTSNGDRILVQKYLYQFVEPHRWDVVVFKNPTLPGEDHFIKRLVGRPGETIEIIDGDIYIDGDIQRKPRHVQDALWIPAYHSDYTRSGATGETADIWQRPFRPARPDSEWDTQSNKHRFVFNGSSQFDRLEFDYRRIRKFALSFCAYNGQRYDDKAIVSDLKLAFLLTPNADQGRVSVLLGKYGRIYRADIDFDGTCTITDEHRGRILQQGRLAPLPQDRPVEVAFANVDHQLLLRVGKQKLDYAEPLEWGYDPKNYFQLPSVTLAAIGGALTMEHIVLSRDVYYTDAVHSGGPGRASMGHPFQLKDNEFFVLGDNSPVSHDSRFWKKPPLANGTQQYRAGIVPRDYLVGRALLVYWPGGFFPSPNTRFGLIPNVGEMRFIY